jgi:predicted GNAT family N-acyltransferase
MKGYEFSRLLPRETWPLRAAILWPEKEVGPGCELDVDAAEGALHFGIKQDDLVVCVGSFLPQVHPENSELTYRLRAMATSASHRKKGLGRMLIEGALAELMKVQVKGVWADARHAALGFYARLDWEVSGPTYEVTNRGLHRLVWVRIDE